MTTSLLTRCAIYCCDGPGHPNVADQLNTCRQFIDANKHHNFIPAIQEFVDSSADGGKQSRSALHTLQNFAAAGQVEAIVVSAMACLGDRNDEVLKELLRLVNAGLAVVSVKDRFCSNSTWTNKVFDNPTI